MLKSFSKSVDDAPYLAEKSLNPSMTELTSFKHCPCCRSFTFCFHWLMGTLKKISLFSLKRWSLSSNCNSLTKFPYSIILNLDLCLTGNAPIAYNNSLKFEYLVKILVISANSSGTSMLTMIETERMFAAFAFWFPSKYYNNSSVCASIWTQFWLIHSATSYFQNLPMIVLKQCRVESRFSGSIFENSFGKSKKAFPSRMAEQTVKPRTSSLFKDFASYMAYRRSEGIY